MDKFKILLDTMKELAKAPQVSSKVLNYESAESLEENTDFNLEPDQDVIGLIKSYLDKSVKTNHPFFMNQLFAGLDPISAYGEAITALTNTTMATYEVAPAATIIENNLIKRLTQILGYSEGEGIMLTGGSNANLVAMNAARTKLFPLIKRQGQHQTLRLYVSRDAHYSYAKAAVLMGLGLDNLVKINVDEHGCMEPEDLIKHIAWDRAQGHQPFFIGLTAGTTVRGAFDKVKEISPIAKAEGLWLHVDGAWGAPVIFSKKYKHLLEGVEEADSFTWDAHKLMGASIVSTFFLTKHLGTLWSSHNTSDGDYLFHQNQDSDWDLGPMSLQCGRKVDSLGLWLAWKYYGEKGYSQRVEKLYELRDYWVGLLNSDDDFQLVYNPAYLNVCFTTPDMLELRSKLLKSGEAMVNYAKTAEGKPFFRMIFANPDLTKENLDELWIRFKRGVA